MAESGLRINYYISGHGFGHATRSAKVAEALLDADPSVHITIFTTAPSRFFPVCERLTVRFHEVDSAIVQPQPYSIDAAASFEDLKRFIRQVDKPEWRATAEELLRETRCRLILADAPCPFAWAGFSDGVPSILISNFSFDAIFRKLLEYLQQCDTAPEEAMVLRLEKTYALYDFLLRLPGCVEFPFVHAWTEDEVHRRVLDSPLVFRSPRSSRVETFQKLNIPYHLRNSKILLVQFGGHNVAWDSLEPPKLPAGWICLTDAAAINDPQFFLFPKDVYSPDLIALSDVVLSKVGYGTVSECVGLAKPLVFVRRPIFAEEPGLLGFMECRGTCMEISIADYESGNWAATVESAQKAHSLANWREVPDGSSQVASMILDIARDAKRT